MLNQIVIAGRLTAIEKENTEEGKTKAYVIVKVPRSYKNINGEYENDFIKCYLWNGIAETTTEYCKIGDVVGIKGRMQTTEENGENMIIVAEKVSFLSSRREENKGE